MVITRVQHTSYGFMQHAPFFFAGATVQKGQGTVAWRWLRTESNMMHAYLINSRQLAAIIIVYAIKIYGVNKS
jgi:hypothetical protein